MNAIIMDVNSFNQRRLAGSSVLIPVHRGRENHLIRLLASLAGAQRSSMYPVEVLIVTKDISEIDRVVRSSFPEFPVPIRTAVFPDAKTLAELRNEGLRSVQTEWVHSVDSDTILPPDYFVRLEDEMKRFGAEIQCFQLNFAPLPGGSCWARYEAAMDQWVISWYVQEEGVYGLIGANFLARPDALLSVGGFARELVAGEDVDLGYRLHQAGIAVAFLPEVLILHQYPNRLTEVLRRKFWHGQGYALIFQRCPDLYRKRHDAAQRISLLSKRLLHPGFLFYYIVSNAAFMAGVYHYRFFQRRSQHS